MVKVVYNDKLIYKVVIWVGFLDYFMKREGSFWALNPLRDHSEIITGGKWILDFMLTKSKHEYPH